MSRTNRVEVMVAAPLEEELAARIGEAGGEVELLYEPELLPPRRYVSDHKGDPDFVRDAAGERRWRELVERAEVIYGVPGESAEGLAELLERGGRLRWVQATNAGTGQQVREAGIPPGALDRVAVTTASGVHATPLAEFCLMGLLHFARRVPRLSQLERDRIWRREPARELRDMTLLVVGLGGIGTEVARLAECFGMEVLGVKRRPGGEEPHVREVYPPERLREVLPEADAVVVTLPLTDETGNLFDREAVAAMKPDAIFVNVGRGGVVDEAALLEALEEERLAGAALDVFREEPLPPESRFWELENVLVSPHSAAVSESETGRIVELFVDNLRRYLAGEPLANRLRPDHLY